MTSRDMLVAAAGSGGGWINTLATGSNDTNRGTSIARDSSGNVYVAGYGYTQGYGFLAKYNSGGVLQWQKTFTRGAGATGAAVSKVIVSSSGYIYISLTTSAGGGYQNGSFVLKYDSSGTQIWKSGTEYASSEASFITATFTLDSSDNVYVVGNMNNIGPGAFMYKLNSSGVRQWIIRYGNNNSYQSAGVSVNSSGEIVWIISYSDSIPQRYIYILKLNSSGTLLWQRQSPQGMYARAAYFDSADNIYLSSSLAGTDFIKLNGSAVIQWQKSLATSTLINVYGDSSGFVYFVGAVGSSTAQNALIVKCAADGTLQWQRTLTTSGTAAADAAQAIFADSSDSYLITGFTLQSPYRVINAQLPTSGSGAGTYTGFTYATASLTESTTSFGSFTTPALSLTTPSPVYTITALTESTGTFTSSTVYL